MRWQCQSRRKGGPSKHGMMGAGAHLQRAVFPEPLLAGQWLRHELPVKGTGVQTLIGEPRSHAAWPKKEGRGRNLKWFSEMSP